MTSKFQHQADTEKGFQVREQVCQAPKEGVRSFFTSPQHFFVSHVYMVMFIVQCTSLCSPLDLRFSISLNSHTNWSLTISGCRVQLPKPAEDGQEEGVLDGRRRGRWGQSSTRWGWGPWWCCSFWRWWNFNLDVCHFPAKTESILSEKQVNSAILNIYWAQIKGRAILNLFWKTMFCQKKFTIITPIALLNLKPLNFQDINFFLQLSFSPPFSSISKVKDEPSQSNSNAQLTFIERIVTKVHQAVLPNYLHVPFIAKTSWSICIYTIPIYWYPPKKYGKPRLGESTLT